MTLLRLLNAQGVAGIALSLALGILLAVCGLGYCGAQFVQGGPPDAVKLGLGIVMTAVAAIVIATSARGLRPRA